MQVESALARATRDYEYAQSRMLEQDNGSIELELAIKHQQPRWSE
jgi:hypothetical protein